MAELPSPSKIPLNTPINKPRAHKNLFEETPINPQAVEILCTALILSGELSLLQSYFERPLQTHFFAWLNSDAALREERLGLFYDCYCNRSDADNLPFYSLEKFMRTISQIEEKLISKKILIGHDRVHPEIETTLKIKCSADLLHSAFICLSKANLGKANLDLEPYVSRIECSEELGHLLTKLRNFTATYPSYPVSEDSIFLKWYEEDLALKQSFENTSFDTRYAYFQLILMAVNERMESERNCRSSDPEGIAFLADFLDACPSELRQIREKS